MVETGKQWVQQLVRPLLSGEQWAHPLPVVRRCRRGAWRQCQGAAPGGTVPRGRRVEAQCPGRGAWGDGLATVLVRAAQEERRISRMPTESPATATTTAATTPPTTADEVKSPLNSARSALTM